MYAPVRRRSCGLFPATAQSPHARATMNIGLSKVILRPEKYLASLRRASRAQQPTKHRHAAREVSCSHWIDAPKTRRLYGDQSEGGPDRLGDSHTRSSPMSLFLEGGPGGSSDRLTSSADVSQPYRPDIARHACQLTQECYTRPRYVQTRRHALLACVETALLTAHSSTRSRDEQAVLMMTRRPE